MIVDKKLLDDLSAQAKANPRLRQAMDLRNSPEDMSQRMLNAIEPGTVMPIHRHLASSETVTLLRGKVRWHFYDDAGNKTEIVILDANGDVRCINVEKGRWHSLECMESGSVHNKISFVAMIVALFAKKHRYTEPVAYQYLSRYGGDRLLVNHYGYLHTQDYDQVVDDLDDYCRRNGGTL